MGDWVGTVVAGWEIYGAVSLGARLQPVRRRHRTIIKIYFFIGYLSFHLEKRF